MTGLGLFAGILAWLCLAIAMGCVTSAGVGWLLVAVPFAFLSWLCLAS